MVGALEFRLLGLRSRGEAGGWIATVEVYVRNPETSIRNAAGTKDMLTRTEYRVSLDSSAELLDFEQISDAGRSG